MLQGRPTRARDYYDDHPIGEAQVLAALRRRGSGVGPVTPEDLLEFDQDHYGGLAAVDALARRAGITGASRVLDVCGGLGGPARFLASRRGCRVVVLDLHRGRAAGAARLTRLVGLERRVSVVRGDAAVLPLRPASFDACLSQEGFLHVEDKAAVLAGCHRVLVSGGRLAFTDWIAFPGLGARERARLRDWMAARTLQSLDGYRALLGRAGFGAIEAEDVTDAWRPILRTRLARLRAMSDGDVARLGERRREEHDRLLAFFAGLVEAGRLGGGRFSATRS